MGADQLTDTTAAVTSRWAAGTVGGAIWNDRHAACHGSWQHCDGGEVVVAMLLDGGLAWGEPDDRTDMYGMMLKDMVVSDVDGRDDRGIRRAVPAAERMCERRAEKGSAFLVSHTCMGRAPAYSSVHPHTGTARLPQGSLAQDGQAHPSSCRWGMRWHTRAARWPDHLREPGSRDTGTMHGHGSWSKGIS